MCCYIIGVTNVELAFGSKVIRPLGMQSVATSTVVQAIGKLPVALYCSVLLLPSCFIHWCNYL